MGALAGLHATLPQLRLAVRQGDVLLATGVLAILIVLILPLPAFLLDLCLAISITLSVLILLTALFIERPLEFSAFPTVLLIATMLRLALNLASTRLILGQGHQGPDAAGHVIEAFGRFIMQGNLVIGIIVFAILPAFGVANAAATLVGQNLGAGKPERAEAAAWKAGLYNTIVLGVVGLGFLSFAPQLIGVFTADPEVASYGIRCLRIVAAGFLFYGYGLVFTAAFNGAGDTWTPTWINLGCMWTLELPLAWVLLWRRIGSDHRRLALVALAWFAGLMLVANIYEPRVYGELLVLLYVPAAAAACRWLRADTLGAA